MAAEIHDHARPIGPKLESGRMERPRSAQPAPVADHAPAPKSAEASASGGAKGGAYQFAATQGLRVGKGVGHAASGAATGGGGTIALLALTFLVVGLAKYQGANIQLSKALFGGFVLAVVLSALSKVNNRLGLMFALLVFIAAMLEYGSNIASIFSNTQTIPAPVPGYNQTGSATTVPSAVSSLLNSGVGQQATSAASGTVKGLGSELSGLSNAVQGNEQNPVGGINQAPTSAGGIIQDAYGAVQVPVRILGDVWGGVKDLF